MRGTRKSIWHDAKEEPWKDGFILVEKKTDDCGDIYYGVVGMEWIRKISSCWDDYVYFNYVVRWCYISDLESL